MIEKVRAAIGRYKMLEDGEAAVVGLSGGADSVSLLILLSELGYSVSAVHVNHRLRGAESEHDEAFCRNLCKDLGVDFSAVSVDVLGHAEKTGKSIELAARDLRYEALYSAAGKSKIALAHTLSDCLETSVFNLIRGAGVHGLASIPPVRGQIIRPLIDCTREEIEEYLKSKNQPYVTDSTNLEPDCSRNIIRLNVVPELKKITPGLYASYLNSLNAVREADRYIEEKAAELLNLHCEDFSGISDDAVLSRALAIYLQNNGVEPSYDRISSAKSLIKFDGRINIKKGVYLCSHAGRLSFERDAVPEPEYRFDMHLGGDFGGVKIYVTKLSPFDISHYQKKELRYIVDESEICGEYTLRKVIGGEKIRLAGRGMTQEIKKLLSPDERKSNYIIADSLGAVFVEGVGVSERISCTDKTTSALKIDIIRREKNDL